MLAIALAVFGAFAFGPAPAKAELVDIWGLIPTAECPESNVKCSQINTNPFCTNGTVDLYEMNQNGLDCDVHLYRK